MILVHCYQVNSLKQNGISLIQSYGHFVTSSDKQKRQNEASDELFGEAKTVLR